MNVLNIWVPILEQMYVFPRLSHQTVMLARKLVILAVVSLINE